MTQSNTFKIAISTLTASLVGIWTYQVMTNIAFIERGYHAVGGEWVIIVLVPILVFKLLNKMLRS